MKRLVVLIFFLLIPSVAFTATTTATVNGTLKIYEGITIIRVKDLIFPAQFAGTLGSALINTQGAAPANGIPNIINDTQGRAGLVVIQGTGGTAFTTSVPATMSLTGPSTISATLSTFGDNLFTQPAPTVIPGVGLGVTAEIFIKGIIASGVQLIAGTYNGTVTFTVTYN